MLAIGFLSFIVWAHHMYLTGMGTKISAFFQATTMVISIPSVIILTCLFISLWGGSIRFNTPMLFALAFLPMFGIGGLTGLPLGFNASDVYLHDTYYVIAHFHYVVAPGTIFALFAGIYYWFPKMTGRKMNEFWGRVHFWCSFVFMNLVFMPMFAQGMKGMLRRMADGGANYSAARVPGVLDTLPGSHHGTAHVDSVGGGGAGHRANSIHHQFVLEHQPRRKSGATIRGTPRRSNGRRPRRRRTAILPGRRKFIAALTNTACPATTTDFTPQNEPEILTPSPIPVTVHGKELIPKSE